MKHLIYAGKPLLVDDHLADLLLEYAGLLPGTNEGDDVTVTALGPDGNVVDVTMVLNPSTELIAETTNTSIETPANDVAIAYLTERIQTIRHPPIDLPDDVVDGEVEFDVTR